MDKLKENGFAIGVGALVVLLLAFLWFWVLAPVFNDIGAAATRLDNVNTQIERYTKEGVVKPTRDYLEYKKDYRDQLESALEVAVDFYQTKKKRFEEFLPPHSEDSDPGAFRIFLESEIKSLRDAYDERFGRGPEFSLMPLQQQLEIGTKADVKLWMKRYWMLKEIVDALTALEVGGLQEIRFPPPNKDDPPTPPTYDPVRCDFKVEIPITKARSLVTRLFESERVPFVDLETLDVRRDPEKVIAQLLVEKEYEHQEEAASDKAAFTASVEEPPVTVRIVVTALDWKGIPEPQQEDEEASAKSKRKR